MAIEHAKRWQATTGTQTQTEKQVVVKVRKSGWITKGEKILWSLVSAVLITMAVYIVSYSSSIDTLNQEVQSVEQLITDQVIVNEGLLFEVRELSRPERITRIAKENGLKIQDAKVKSVQSFNN